MNSKNTIKNRLEVIKKKQEEISDIDKEIDNIASDMYDDYDSNEAESYESYTNNPEYILGKLSNKKETKQKEIMKLEAEIEKENFNNIYEKEKNKYKNGVVVSDKETIDDLLSRKTYSKILAEYISNETTETPFNIGIFGKWGEGKSSFIKFIEEELWYLNSNPCNENDFFIHTVRYDASEYSEQNKIWSSLLKKLFDKFEEEKGFGAKVSFAYHRFVKKFNENLWKYVFVVITFLLLIIWGYCFNRDINNLSELKKIVFYSSVGIIPLIMSVTNIIIPFIRNQIEFVKPLSDRVVSNINLPNYDKELGIRENIKEDLEDLLYVWLKNNRSGKGKKERIVIFVDELDRCYEKGIIEFLDALQLFLAVEDVIIILTINYNSIYRALIEKYDYLKNENISESSKIKFCKDYIEKYISIPVYLRYDGSYNEYTNKLLDNAENIRAFDKILNDEALTTKDEEPSINNLIEKTAFNAEERELFNHIIKKANEIKHITPREVKRVLNIIIISKQAIMTLNNKSVYKEKIKFANYMRWLFFAYFNPKSSFELLRYIKGTDKYKKLKFIIPFMQNDDKLKVSLSDEIYFKQLQIFLSEIIADELIIFKDISNYFVIDERNFII